MWTMHCPNMSWIHKFKSDFKWLNNIFVILFDSICHLKTSHKHNRFGRASQDDEAILKLRTNLSKEREFVPFSILNVISFHCFVISILEQFYCWTYLLKNSPFSSLPDSQVSDGKLVPQEDYKNDYTHVGFTHMNVKDWIDKINSILI